MIKMRTLALVPWTLLSTHSLHSQIGRDIGLSPREICINLPRSPRRGGGQRRFTPAAMMQELQWRRPYAVSSTCTGSRRSARSCGA